MQYQRATRGVTVRMSEFHDRQSAPTPLRVLTLDGGGAKGFYTLGVLKEIEAMTGCPLHQRFDLVFGTSTGAIIASLIALGHGADAILELYRKHVPAVMSQTTAHARRSEEHTSELQSLMRISYAVFCLKKKNASKPNEIIHT